MRLAIASVLLAPLLLASPPLAPSRPSTPAATRAATPIAANDNRSSAGVLRDGVLTLRLEVRDGVWHPASAFDPAIAVRAFAEEGKAPLIPGPLVRVPQGTTIRASVRNPLARGTLVVRGLSTRGAAASAADSLVVPAGEARAVAFTAGAPGTYFYTGRVVGADAADGATIDAMLNGAFVVDEAGAPRRPGDRVLVLGLWTRQPAAGVIGQFDVLRFTINGRSWPHTERLAYDLGDTVRFRVINTSAAVHPMHLHGFYFDVTSRGNGAIDSVYGRGVEPHRVVTERLAPARTATMTWVPERAGNWLFHCHDNFHVLRNPPLDGTRLPAEHEVHATNHTLEMMGGLVMGIEVRGQDRTVYAAGDGARRRLRLVAMPDSGGTTAEPFYRYALSGDGIGAMPSAPPGPTIVLKRGEPVSITVVNRLPEATAVHWHGIELDSYFDGVPGFSGRATRLSPVIAPRDSFEARFTPPRSGTFMYHPHADEVRQQKAGLAGSLLVVDEPARLDPAREIVLMITAPRTDAEAGRLVYVNGTGSPAPLELRAGETYRLRFVDVHTFRPSMVMRLLRDTSLVTWRAVAKDGMALPASRATVRPSIQQMGNGETYDFELTPEAPGELTLTVSSAAGQLLATVPVRVR